MGIASMEALWALERVRVVRLLPWSWTWRATCLADFFNGTVLGENSQAVDTAMHKMPVFYLLERGYVKAGESSVSASSLALTQVFKS